MFVCTSILFGYYWLFLRNKKFHHYNRFYLLSIVIVSIVFPFIKVPILFPKAEQNPTSFYQVVQTLSVNEWENEDLVIDHANPSFSEYLTWQNLAIALAVLGMVWMLVRLLSSLQYLRRIRQDYPSEKIADLQLYYTNEPGTPFSYFRSIFWNNNISFNSVKGQQIFRHELFHVRQSHSADNLFMELICSIAWFNPLFYLIRRELKTVHEFLADQYSISESNRYEYAELLLQESIRLKTNPLVQPFFHSQIKRRIAMITKIAHSKYGYASRVLVLPILVLLFFSLVLKAQNATQNANNNIPETNSIIKSDEQITIVVDAGHGGEIPGALGSLNGKNYYEKDINLQIAKRVQSIAERYNVKVIMTREADLQVHQTKRLEIAENSDYDLFLSIHINAQNPKKVGTSFIPQTSKNGFEVFIGSRNKSTLNTSSRLANILIQSLGTCYKTFPTVKQRMEEGVYVLDKPSKPSVIVECGYITNPADLEFMLNETNQEKIAQKILEGIVGFNQSTKKSGNIYHDVQRELMRKIKYPENALHGNQEGEAIVSFVIDDNGKIVSLTPITEDSVGLVQEALRSLQMLPADKLAELKKNRSGAHVLKVIYLIETTDRSQIRKASKLIDGNSINKTIIDFEIVVTALPKNSSIVESKDEHFIRSLKITDTIDVTEKSTEILAYLKKNQDKVKLYSSYLDTKGEKVCLLILSDHRAYRFKEEFFLKTMK